MEPLPFPHASSAPGVTDDPANPPFAEYGYKELKGKLRAHPPAGRRTASRGAAQPRATPP